MPQLGLVGALLLFPPSFKKGSGSGTCRRIEGKRNVSSKPWNDPWDLRRPHTSHFSDPNTKEPQSAMLTPFLQRQPFVSSGWETAKGKQIHLGRRGHRVGQCTQQVTDSLSLSLSVTVGCDTSWFSALEWPRGRNMSHGADVRLGWAQRLGNSSFV